MFGKSSQTKELAGLIKKLEQEERRPAQHVRPHKVTDKGFETFATAGVQAVFEGFEYFGALMNQHFAEPWTVEETGDTLVKDLRSDSPELGRTYQVFYNGVKLGRLQVTEGFNPAGALREDVAWHLQNRAAHALLELDYLRFVPYDHVLSMVAAIELFVGSFENNDIARPRARANAAAALTGYLWEVQRADEQYVPSFEHRVEGPYDLLKYTTDHWKEGGLDPFERWNGDRSR